MPQMKILNSKGKPILLSKKETALANSLQRQLVANGLGFQIDITTMTTIMKLVSEQKFFEIAPADYIPLRVGNGAWSTSLLTYRSFMLGDDFETGNINTGGNNGRLASADAGVDGISVAVVNWAKSIGWTLIELQQAAKAGNWDLVVEKERARKKNYDLGIQKIAFLGSSSNTAVKGLYTQTGITTDTTILPQPISTLSPVDLKAFCIALLNAYRSNCNRTAWPSHFVIPESDYLGLAGPSVAEFPIKSTLAQLEEMFAIITKKPFKILPNAYGDAAYSGQAYQQYALYNAEETSLRMDIPVPYTNTLANSLDNFSFQNAGYSQYTGVQAYRPLELYYMHFVAS